MFHVSRPLVSAAATFLTAASVISAGDPFVPERERMVREQLVSRGIRGPDVLRAMRLTPRHLFVPQTIRDMAYDDCALPIGHSATISQPYIVALMTELLFPGKRHRILEIGTGSGYQTALLAQLGRYVYTVEIVPELAESARATLADLKYSNVVVRQGDGYLGWPEEAPFDRIIITAAPRDLPQSLIDQLALGGRLVAPVGSTWGQQLILVEKDLDGATRRTPIAPVIFVPMRHAREWSP